MASFDEVEELCELPERSTLRKPYSAMDDKMPLVCYGGVMSYVDRCIECLPELSPDEVSLEGLMAALHRVGVQPPVTLKALEAALETLDAEQRTELSKVPQFHARALRTLNGDQFKVVHPNIVKRAALYEAAVAGTVHGWGVVDPPEYAVNWRLLVLAGLPPVLLPKYKTLDPKIRALLMHAWGGACKEFNWQPVNPDCDIRAERRRKAMQQRA